MKIKTKLRLGFGFLFAVVIFFGSLSLFYVNEIAKSSRVILKDNYETLRYVREMRQVLDAGTLPLNAPAIQQFNINLDKEAHNLTERGEKGAVDSLAAVFNKLNAANATPAQLATEERRVRAWLTRIEDINMHAIVRKNDAAQASVQKATLLLGFAAAFTFLVLFSFSVNFPSFISDPLRKLQEGIAEISRKNYSTRLNFRQNDEFADVAQAFNDMASRLKNWENSNLATVLSEKRRIEAIIGQMRDAIIGVNEKQEILFINDAAKTVLSLQDQSPEGQVINELTKYNDLLRSVTDKASAGKSMKIVVDGRESHFQLETRDINVPNMQDIKTDGIVTANQPAGTVYILKDITEFKERDEAKTNFIATISHELKTPISSIKMSLNLLGNERIGKINEEQRQLISHITEDSERLLKITGELLELSQAETGNLQLHISQANPLEILDYAIAAVQTQAKQKGVAINTVRPEDLPLVNADAEKTAWVLVNFLSNALRYSHENSKIVITLNKQGSMIKFAVQDFGKGVDEQYQQRLFDRYFQVPTDGQNKSGSGLGLAISRDFIEAQNGTIGVISAIGEGSTFYFTLPVVA